MAGARLSPYLFFISGAAALVYEISWSRQFGAVFGHSVETAGLVLSGYFGGLAAGYWLAGRRPGRLPPLAAYGVLEIAAAAWTFVVPLLLERARPLAGGGPALAAARTAFCFLALLPGAACLGATWPRMAEVLQHGGRTWGYALNTAGAVLGTVLATVALIAIAGVRGSATIAAAVGTFCGVAAIALSRTGLEPRPTDAGDAPAPDWKWTALVGISGFLILALEVLYLRLFSLVFQNSTYTFGAVVAAFLLSLAVGGALAAALGPRVPAATLAAGACGLGAAAIGISLAAFAGLTGFRYFDFGDGFPSHVAGAFGLVLLVILPPVAALGMILPASWRSRDVRAVAGLTTASTVSGAAGTLAASFAFLPFLGLWNSFALIGAAYFAAASAVLLRRGRLRLWSGLVLASAAALGIAVWTVRGAVQLPPGENLVRRWEGAYGWIDVVRTGSGALRIRQNLHYSFGSSGIPALRDYRQAHLALLLHPRPEETAFLGLGTGQTAAAALLHDVRSVTVVELVPEAVEAARLFSRSNLGVVDDRRVEIRVGDARRFLATTERRFDVIVSDLFVPWESQTGYLYTVEHYRAARARLKPGGLFSQWLPLYQLGPAEFEAIADSFAAAFPVATLWWGQLERDRAVVALVGSESPIDFPRVPAARGWTVPSPETGIVDPHLVSGEAIAALHLGRWPVRPSAFLNSDEHPRVEFLAPISNREGRLLAGSAMLLYYEGVLTRLPEDGVLRPPIGRESRLATQRAAIRASSGPSGSAR